MIDERESLECVDLATSCARALRDWDGTLVTDWAVMEMLGLVLGHIEDPEQGVPQAALMEAEEFYVQEYREGGTWGGSEVDRIERTELLAALRGVEWMANQICWWVRQWGTVNMVLVWKAVYRVTEAMLAQSSGEYKELFKVWQRRGREAMVNRRVKLAEDRALRVRIGLVFELGGLPS